MRIKVELRREVVRYVRHQCSLGERTEFFEQLERIKLDPITNSEATVDLELSRYILRFFRFGQKIAVFQFDPANDRVVIRLCRTTKRIERRRRATDEPP